MARQHASDFDPALRDMLDDYVHGGISRRQFIDGAGKFAVGGVAAAALVDSLSPTYAAETQQVSPDDGRLETVGFCYGGGVVNALAVRIPDLGAGVPFYGSQPAAEDVPKINAPLLIQYAGLDERINAGWPAYEAALQANGKTYAMHMYEGTNHGFHNDTTPRFDEAAAALAWERTVAFFNEHLR